MEHDPAADIETTMSPMSSRRGFLQAAAIGAVALGLDSVLDGTREVQAAEVALTLPLATEAVTRFRVAFSPAKLDDLKRRLTAIRWPERETVTDGSQGVRLAKMRALVDYWRSGYDLHRIEKRLNGFPQFRTEIDGLGIHFLHVKSKQEKPLPIILTHVWPGSVVEFLNVMGPLTDPKAHGGTAEDAFHVVVPPLPGYGFSDKPTEMGWGLPRIARAWATLMKRLGYTNWVAQGGDWGAGVTTWMAKQHVDGLKVTHLNLPILLPPPIEGEPSEEEKSSIAQLIAFNDKLSGYAKLQSTRPQTIGYGLTDSPVGQAAWIYEKFGDWTDSNGEPEQELSRDEMLDNITLYWLTDTAASSARLYAESLGEDFSTQKADIPVAVSVFPGELYRPLKVWGERIYSKLFYWNEVSKGGHFAAFEQPDLFVAELRKSLRALR
jgi:pimeloyl-ACP methyl ester carboxylesterase